MEDPLLEDLHDLLHLHLMVSKKECWIRGGREKPMALISPVVEFYWNFQLYKLGILFYASQSKVVFDTI